MPQKGQEFRGLSWGLTTTATASSTCLAAPQRKTALSVVLHNDAGKHFTERCLRRSAWTIPNRSARQSNWGRLRQRWRPRSARHRLRRREPIVPQRRRAASPRSPPGPRRPIPGPLSAPAGSISMTMATSICSTANQARRRRRDVAQRRRSLHRHRRGNGHDRAEAHDRRRRRRGAPSATSTTMAISTSSSPNYGHNQLYRRNGDRTFTEVAATVGLAVENHVGRRGLGRHRQRRRPGFVGDVLRRGRSASRLLAQRPLPERRRQEFRELAHPGTVR